MEFTRRHQSDDVNKEGGCVGSCANCELTPGFARLASNSFRSLLPNKVTMGRTDAKDGGELGARYESREADERNAPESPQHGPSSPYIP